jgi:hypothetical protein
MLARPARTAAVPTEEIRRHAALIEKHVLGGIVEGQSLPPPPTLRSDVRAPLFVGVHGFF